MSAFAALESTITAPCGVLEVFVFRHGFGAIPAFSYELINGALIFIRGDRPRFQTNEKWRKFPNVSCLAISSMLKANIAGSPMDRAAKSMDSLTVWQVPEAFRTIYSHACEAAAGHRVLMISGQVGVSPDGSLLPTFAAQCEQAIDNVEALLTAGGMTTANLVKLTYYVVRAEDFLSLGEIRRRRWASAEPPAVTALVVVGLARPEYVIEIEAVAATSA